MRITFCPQCVSMIPVPTRKFKSTASGEHCLLVPELRNGITCTAGVSPNATTRDVRRHGVFDRLRQRFTDYRRSSFRPFQHTHHMVDADVNVKMNATRDSSPCPSNVGPSPLVYQEKPCRLTFVFDPRGKFCYVWSAAVSAVILYNLWIIAYRVAFDEIHVRSQTVWFTLDYVGDLVYVIDIVMGFRTGFFDDGVLQTASRRMRIHYLNTSDFYLDCLSVLPLDIMYLSSGYQSAFRLNRLVKLYKLLRFVDTTERHTTFPQQLRLLVLLHNVCLVIHWNACLLFCMRGLVDIVPRNENTSVNCSVSDTGSNTGWLEGNSCYNYLLAFYATLQTLTLTQPIRPKPSCKTALVFVNCELIFALLLFATVLGYVAGLVSTAGTLKRTFQVEVERVKNYLKFHRVPRHLQLKISRWFDHYWNANHAGHNDYAAMDCLPEKLRAEVAIHVHLDTLKKVEIFQNTEPGFLRELVLRLKPLLCSPGDYVCRKGEVGKEMYIVGRGKLRVADGNGRTLATLRAGSYFGEIAILDMGSVGNRRTASVVSVGYSDLFVLTKRNIWDVLEDYPAARMRMEAIARRRLQEMATVQKQQDNEGTTGAVQQKTMLDYAQSNSDRCVGDDAVEASGLEDTNSVSSAPGFLESTSREPLVAIDTEMSYTVCSNRRVPVSGHQAEPQAVIRTNENYCVCSTESSL